MSLSSTKRAPVFQRLICEFIWIRGLCSCSPFNHWSPGIGIRIGPRNSPGEEPPLLCELSDGSKALESHQYVRFGSRQLGPQTPPHTPGRQSLTHMGCLKRKDHNETDEAVPEIYIRESYRRSMMITSCNIQKYSLRCK